MIFLLTIREEFIPRSKLVSNERRALAAVRMAALSACSCRDAGESLHLIMQCEGFHVGSCAVPIPSHTGRFPPHAGMLGRVAREHTPTFYTPGFFAIPSRIIRSIVCVICRGLHWPAAAVSYRGFPSFP